MFVNHTWYINSFYLQLNDSEQTPTSKTSFKNQSSGQKQAGPTDIANPTVHSFMAIDPSSNFYKSVFALLLFLYISFGLLIF